jgi:hypothetical protein
VRIIIGRDSEHLRYLGNGWSNPDKRSAWVVEPEAWVTLPRPPALQNAVLTLAAFPLVFKGQHDRQRVTVNVNGHDIAAFSIDSAQRLACTVPRAAIDGFDEFRIVLRHMDFARPADFPALKNGDTRQLSIAYSEISIEPLSDAAASIARDIRAALDRPEPSANLHLAPALAPQPARAHAALTLPDLQSLGDDCEFGMVQDQAGVVVLGLFRFTSIAIDNLERGIRNGFADIAAPENVEIVEYVNVADHDYMGLETNYGMRYHTNRFPGQIEPETLKAQELKRLRMLARKFREDLALGEHLFVIKTKPPAAPERVALLLEVLREKGPGCLLWVREGDAAHPPGAAEWVSPGLMLAYVDRIASGELHNISFESWLRACRSAHALWAMQGSASF